MIVNMMMIMMMMMVMMNIVVITMPQARPMAVVLCLSRPARTSLEGPRPRREGP